MAVKALKPRQMGGPPIALEERRCQEPGILRELSPLKLLVSLPSVWVSAPSPPSGTPSTPAGTTWVSRAGGSWTVRQLWSTSANTRGWKHNILYSKLSQGGGRDNLSIINISIYTNIYHIYHLKSK